MREVVGISVVLAIFGAVGVGCVNARLPPSDGTIDLDEVSAELTGIGGTHEFGASPCPQDVGDAYVFNGETVDVEFDLTEDSSQIDVYACVDGVCNPWTAQTIAPGGSVRADIRFNCSSTADVRTDLLLAVTGGASDTFPLALDVIGE